MKPTPRGDLCADIVIAVGKARSMTSVLRQLGESGNNLVNALADGSHPDETREWLVDAVADALRGALDEIDEAAMKLGTGEGA